MLRGNAASLQGVAESSTLMGPMGCLIYVILVSVPASLFSVSHESR